jgi:hypothetical protein
MRRVLLERSVRNDVLDLSSDVETKRKRQGVVEIAKDEKLVLPLVPRRSCNVFLEKHTG